MELIIWLVLFFLALPAIGVLLFFVPQWITGVRRKAVVKQTFFWKNGQIEQVQKTPDVHKELNIIPIQDAMAVGSNGEKRSLLFEQMKKGMDANYKVILPAGSDAEAAHYVATARMEINRQKHVGLLELQERARTNPTNVSALREYMKGLAEYVDIGVLEPKEEAIYREEYCTYFMKLHRVDADCIDATEVACYLESLISLGETGEAEDLWKVCPEDKRSEAGYRVILNMYYNQKEKGRFFKCLKELEESDISLSPEGLMLLRFWIARREQ